MIYTLLGARLLVVSALSMTIGARLVAQDPPAPTSTADLAERWLLLRARLDAPDPAPPAPALQINRRVELLRQILASGVPTRAAERDALLQARCRLARLELARLDSTAAASEFRRVLEADPAAPLDLRGTAAHGLALSLELAGDVAAARTAHQEVLTTYVGTRYADWSRLALARLRTIEERQVQVGRPLPDWGPRLDIDGRSRSLDDHYGEPRLLCVWSAADPAQLDRIVALVDAARDGGLAAPAICHVVLHSTPAEARRLAAGRNLVGQLLVSGREALDPVVLRYGLTATPSWLLAGPDDTLLLRDAPPARLRQVLRQLLERR